MPPAESVELPVEPLDQVVVKLHEALNTGRLRRMQEHLAWWERQGYKNLEDTGGLIFRQSEPARQANQTAGVVGVRSSEWLVHQPVDR